MNQEKGLHAEDYDTAYNTEYRCDSEDDDDGEKL